MAIQADIQAGNPRLEPASSGASPPGAVAFASRMLTDLYEQAVLKDVDPCEVARGLELEPEQKIELFTWITHVAIAQRVDEAASRARHRGA